MKSLPLIALVLAALLAGCIGSGVNAQTTSGTVTIPLAQISTTLQKYSLDVNGVQIRYFTVRGSDGEVRTAFDACDVCGGHRDYTQRDSTVVCNNCGQTFNINSLGTGNRGGGCWPSYLSHRVEGDNIVIDRAELARGAFRFS